MENVSTYDDIKKKKKKKKIKSTKNCTVKN